jgi:ABC-type branched-subunit amino acid transport system substrate-binding protein
VTGISGSNDTTGKDCVRYGFRQNFYGETAANAIGPVLVKQFGKNRKAAFMTPDYTYGHTVTKSVNDYLTKNAGWTMVTNQVSRHAGLQSVSHKYRKLGRGVPDQRELGP